MNGFAQGVILVLLLTALAASGYLLYNTLPGKTQVLVPIPSTSDEPAEVNDVTQAVQFYPNMRFPSKAIGYSIDPSCDSSQKANAQKAFAILSDKTVLEFYPASNGDIEVLCSEIAPQPEFKDHFVAGEGGPTEVINTSLYAVIFAGKISLYREEKCDEPHIALHELLHVLGFDHTTNKLSILYPTLDCKQELDQNIIDKIDKLYSADSNPDLIVVGANVTKTGPYLNFEVETLNQGLASVPSTTLRVMADDKQIKDFELTQIPIGTKKILTVSNLKIPRSTQHITFIVDPMGEIDELYENNNKLNLVLQ